ncbi:MAG TPA: DUF2079 domain-containing protein, partial [Ktedonobacteraceae bacterium]|nr:DUF2079 domain-containing protein [Ktedonobacteraceae bacterium]
LSLLYAFHADPRILLVFQTLVLGSGAIPVFLLARKYIPEWPIFATLMAAAYLLSPALLGLNIFDFHPVSLATPFLLYAILALTYKRYIWFLIACVLACMCKEDIPLSVALLGILVIWKYKLPRLGTVLLIGGLLWSFLAFKVIIPHFYPGVQANNYWYRYEALGSSPGAAIANLIIHPWLLFTTFFTLDRFYYLFGLVRSVGFLPLLAPEWLLPALPSLAVNLLSTDPLLYSGVYHYNAAIIPFVMLAAIHGMRRLIIVWQGWRQETPAFAHQTETEDILAGSQLAPAPENISKALDHSVRSSLALTTSSDSVSTPTHLTSGTFSIALFNSSLLTLFAHMVDFLKPRFIGLTLPSWRHEQWQRFSERMSPLAKMLTISQLQWVVFIWIVLLIWLNYMIAIPQLNAFWADHTPGVREEQIQRVLALIPPDASVSAGTNLNPHLSERQLLAVFPSVCLDTRCDQTVQYVVVDLNDVTVENQAEAINELNGLSKLYRPLARADGVILLERRST